MTGPPPPRTRAREAGVPFDGLTPGPVNALTDVPGVRVGHVTCWHDGPEGIGRTGVTAVVPDDVATLCRTPIPAGMAVLNGAGELTGSWAIAEWGQLEAPIVLTGTTSVGRALDAVNDVLFAHVPEYGRDIVMNPTVGECDDSHLDDVRQRWVTVADAVAAIEGADGGPVAEGAVGAGTGMISFGCKAGIGTASRVVPDGWTVGVLVLANFGDLADLVLRGAPVGRRLRDEGFVSAWHAPQGSCIGIVATDAPIDGRTCERVARRVGLGLARTGSVGYHGSGEIFCAFSTTRRGSTSAGPASVDVNDLFQAVVGASEEAVLNALFVADTVAGRDGNVAPGLPHTTVLELLAR